MYGHQAVLRKRYVDLTRCFIHEVESEELFEFKENLKSHVVQIVDSVYRVGLRYVDR